MKSENLIIKGLFINLRIKCFLCKAIILCRFSKVESKHLLRIRDDERSKNWRGTIIKVTYNRKQIGEILQNTEQMNLFFFFALLFGNAWNLNSKLQVSSISGRSSQKTQIRFFWENLWHSNLLSVLSDP